MDFRGVIFFVYDDGWSSLVCLQNNDWFVFLQFFEGDYFPLRLPIFLYMIGNQIRKLLSDCELWFFVHFDLVDNCIGIIVELRALMKKPHVFPVRILEDKLCTRIRYCFCYPTFCEFLFFGVLNLLSSNGQCVLLLIYHTEAVQICSQDFHMTVIDQNLYSLHSKLVHQFDILSSLQ